MPVSVSRLSTFLKQSLHAWICSSPVLMFSAMHLIIILGSSKKVIDRDYMNEELNPNHNGKPYSGRDTWIQSKNLIMGNRQAGANMIPTQPE